MTSKYNFGFDALGKWKKSASRTTGKTPVPIRDDLDAVYDLNVGFRLMQNFPHETLRHGAGLPGRAHDETFPQWPASTEGES